MAGGYGSKKNGVRIGCFWDDIQLSADGSQARITDPRVTIDRDVNIVDSTNHLSVSGGAVIDDSWSNTNVSGSGAERVRNCVGQWVTLAYGATVSANFSASMSGIDYAGGTVSETRTVTYPARAYNPPADPSAINVSLDMPNAQATVWWTNNPTAAAPYSNLYVYRSTNGGASWVLIASLPGTWSSFVDTGLVINTRYRYHVYAANSAGASPQSLASGDVYTTPAAPTNATATKNTSGNIVVSWVDQSLYESGFQILHAANGVWDVSPIAIVGPGGTTWTHVGPNAAQTHKYKIAAYNGSLLSPYSLETTAVQLQAPPLAPTNLLPASSTVFNGALSSSLSWRHNPVDTSVQQAYEIQFRSSTDGGTVWSGYTTWASTTASQARSIPGGTFANGRLWQWQVRTKGADPAFGAWSAVATFLTSAPPAVLWESPGNGDVHHTSTLTAVLGYSDPEAKPMSRFRARLMDENQIVLEEVDMPKIIASGTSLSIPFGRRLINETTYRLAAWAWDSDGMMSAVNEASFTTDFPVPMQPEFGELVWDNSTGSVYIPWTNPPISGGPEGTPLTAYNTLSRSEDGGGTWEVIATDLPIDSSLTDWTATLNGAIQYRITAYSSTPTSAVSDIADVFTDNHGQWIFVNGGPAFATWAKMRIDPDYEEDYERPKTVWMFANRDDGVETIGTTRERAMGVSAIIEPDVDRSTREAFLVVADLAAPLLYRDTRGRKWYCSIGKVKFKTKGLTTVSMVLTWVGKNVG